METEYSPSIEPEQDAIKPLSCIFKDSRKEACFRQQVLPKQRSLVFKLCALLTIIMPIFMFSDYMIVKPEPWASFLLGQRFVQIASCLIFLCLILRVRSYLSYDILVFSTVLIFFMLLELGSFTFVDDYVMYVLFDIIIIICLYVSGILSVKLSFILCVYHSLIAIFIILFVKDVGLHSVIIMLLGYSSSNTVGILLAIAQHKNARQQFSLQNSLRESALQLKDLAYRDSLTHALNRRAFQDHFRDIEKMAVRLQDEQKGQFLIAADIDHFKVVNDSFGHDVVDKVLIAFIALVESNIRPLDNVYRFGGEEFMVLLQDCDRDIAIERVEKIMRLLNENCLGVEELDQPVTCSFGITPILISDTMDSVCIRADEALYNAKDSGRNQYRFDSGVASDSQPE
jgi:diguanylate cyclase (GGDEF)-like protein